MECTITRETAKAFARDALRYNWQADPEETAVFLSTDAGQRMQALINELRKGGKKCTSK